MRFSAQQPLDPAQRVAEIGARLGRDVVERILGLVRLAPDRGTGLDDRKLVVAESCAARLAPARSLAPMRLSMRARWSSRVSRSPNISQHVRLDSLRQFVRPPRIAHQPARALAIAFNEHDARQRQFAPGADRRFAREATNRGCIAAILPQPRFRPPA